MSMYCCEIKMGDEVKLIMAVAENFNLAKAVCNHGFFMMSPNKWIPSHKSLVRPLSLVSTNTWVTASISQPQNKNYILIKLLPKNHRQKLLLSSEDQQSIRTQVARMLHISAEDEMMVQDFHKIHPEAKKSGFARIFRSPTLFEDIVKSVLICYCNWARSLEMAEALCKLQQKLYGKKGSSSSSKRKRRACRDDNEKDWWGNSAGGNFPSSKEIACLDEETLNKHCKLGYRASIILEFARNIENGTLNLDDFQTPRATAAGYDLATSHHKLLRDRLIKIKGFGPFTVANVMMCIGFYQHIPVDTETIKHLEQVHGRTKLNYRKRDQMESIAQIYDKFAPFQCLAYWMERVEYYEKNLGKLSQLPHSEYCNVTSTNFQDHTSGNEE